jgi:CheY-like chemotaxis protein
MPEMKAVFVEDEDDQVDDVVEVLTLEGFVTTRLRDFAEASDYLDAATGLIDLFVLDRRLPIRKGESESDEVGDELFRRVKDEYPDSKIVVFTGHADIPQVQAVLAGGGQLPGPGSVDRVSHFTKDQSLKFDSAVHEFAELLRHLNGLEVQGADVSDPMLMRVMRRVALHFEAQSIEFVPLEGGLSNAQVWYCAVRRDMTVVAHVVVKTTTKPRPAGGLPAVLPVKYVAADVADLSGMMGGRRVVVMQLAGAPVESLAEVLARSDHEAARMVLALRTPLSEVASHERTMSLAEVVAPVLGWDEMRDLLESHGLKAPLAAMNVTIAVGLRHCDLHLANVLIVDDGPVLIDFDRNAEAAAAVDPVTLLLTSLVHPNSPIRAAAWPDVHAIESTFGTEKFGIGHSSEEWIAAVWAWISDASRGRNEIWASVLAVGARQLRYEDVRRDPELLSRVIAICRSAIAVLET